MYVYVMTCVGTTGRTERNATGWSKNLLESLLVDLLIEGKEGKL